VQAFLKPLAFAMTGAFCGLAAFLALYFNAPSYSRESSLQCINCHIMRPFFANIDRSPHRAETCSDCHLPHENIFRHYAFKARDGMWDTAMYLTFNESHAIKLHERSRQVIIDNCIRCHRAAMSFTESFGETDRFCGDCHRDIAHPAPMSVTSTPYVQLPPYLPFPDFLLQK